jgi:hypothetical protein
MMTLEEAINLAKSSEFPSDKESQAALADFLDELAKYRENRRIWHNSDLGDHPKDGDYVYVAAVTHNGGIKDLYPAWWSDKNQSFMCSDDYSSWDVPYNIWCEHPIDVEYIPQEWCK